MKRIIRLVALLKGQNGMKTMKSFLIALVVMVTAVVATINVVLNEKDSILSNLTLQNLEAYTNESGESASESGESPSYTTDKCYMSLTEVSNYHMGYRKCDSETTSTVKKNCAPVLTPGHSPVTQRSCINVI